MKVSRIMLISVSLLASACFPAGTFGDGFSALELPAKVDIDSLPKEDIKQAIDRAYLNGEFTSEEAIKAHIQLDVKGHLTAEQIAVIEKDRAKN